MTTLMVTDWPFPKSAQEAIAIQHSLREQVILKDAFNPIRLIAGIDVGYDYKTSQSKAALVTMTIDKLTPVTSVIAYDDTPFPYISGLLSFREAPVILKALNTLKTLPDMLFIDGQGIAHPRRLGIASHIGVLTGLPTIGVAKSRLCGHYTEPHSHKGSMTMLTDKGETIGTVLRSRDNVKPLFISPGHNISVATATSLVLQCLTRYRLPEPTRLADKLSKFTNNHVLI